MKTSKLPRIDSIQELAKFWDTHDLTDFEDELEEVTEPVFASGDSISLHLPSRDAAAVRRLAESKGVSQAELVRQWVLEKLRRRRKSGSMTSSAAVVKEHERASKQSMKTALKSKQNAKALLIRAGIMSKNGKMLAKPYR